MATGPCDVQPVLGYRHGPNWRTSLYHTWISAFTAAMLMPNPRASPGSPPGKRHWMVGL